MIGDDLKLPMFATSKRFWRIYAITRHYNSCKKLTMMLKRSIFLAGLMTAVSAAGWASSGDGPLDMMLVGRYDCELPGPPPLLVPQPMPDRSFTITGSSGYRAADGSRGQYLYSAGSLVLTTGALRGERYSRRSDNWFYRDATEGSAPGLRCIRKPGSSTNVK